jgi:hypothetical protein
MSFFAPTLARSGGCFAGSKMNVVIRQAVLTGRWFLLCALLLSPLSARSDAYVFHFTEVFSGTGPSGVDPWADALFEDVAVGTIRLTLSNVGLIDPESVKEFYFNLGPNVGPGLDPDDLTFLNTSSSGDFNLPTISTGVNEFKADGDGKYDILFTFTPGSVTNEVFGAGESVVYEISGIGTLTVNDFLFLSNPSGGHGPFYAAAHIQNTGGDGDSGWIAPNEATIVPEPASGTFLAFGLASLAALFRKKFAARR